jgi:Flp pilus assembly protein TadB
MIGLGFGLVLVAIIFLFIIPWVGIPVGIIGLLLAILWLAGFLRARGRPGERQI